MKKFVRYACWSLTASIYCGAAFAAMLILRPPNWKLQAVLVLAIGIIIVFIFIVVMIKLKAARLIVENQILHIQSAVLRERNSGKELEIQSCEAVEIFVSCFGILLGSKIIKFNQDGIRLKAVEIGRDYLSLDYGTDRNTLNIQLHHARPDSVRLTDIIEKFRYETGIVPVILQ